MSNLLRERIAVDALLSLSAEQRERFGLYLASPYFKVRQETEQFYQFLLSKIIPDPGEITDEEFYRELLQGVPFKSAHLTRQFFLLLESLMDFFAEEQFQRDKTPRQVQALAELQTWRLDGLYTRKHKKIGKSLEEGNLNSESKIRLRIQYLRGLVSFLLDEGAEKEVMVRLVEAYQLQLSLNYLVSLKLYAAMLNRELLSTDSIPKEVKTPEQPHTGQEQIPLILMFEHVVDMWKAVVHENAQLALTHYSRLKALLDKEEGELEDSEAEDLFVYALNFGSRYDSRTHELPDFDPKGEMYHWLSRILALNLKVGRLDWRVVYGVVVLLLRMNKIQEANEVLEKVDGKFVSDPLNNSLNFIKGMISYNEGDFKEAWRSFLAILGENRLTLVNIHGRTMLLRCLYELGESDLESNSESFRMYLRRSGGKSSGLSPAKLESFKNFNRLVLKVAKTVHIQGEKRRKRNLENLKVLVEETDTVAKDWLLKMIDDAMVD